MVIVEQRIGPVTFHGGPWDLRVFEPADGTMPLPEIVFGDVDREQIGKYYFGVITHDDGATEAVYDWVPYKRPAIYKEMAQKGQSRYAEGRPDWMPSSSEPTRVSVTIGGEEYVMMTGCRCGDLHSVRNDGKVTGICGGPCADHPYETKA